MATVERYEDLEVWKNKISKYFINYLKSSDIKGTKFKNDSNNT